VAEFFYGVARPAAPKRQHVGTRPLEPRGTASFGWIAKLFVGQCYGFIRLEDDRKIYFHRNDIREDMSINDLSVGDPVTFELLEDRISGARALHVRQRRAKR
jgi:cold shock CspA family protein